MANRKENRTNYIFSSNYLFRNLITYGSDKVRGMDCFFYIWERVRQIRCFIKFPFRRYDVKRAKEGEKKRPPQVLFFLDKIWYILTFLSIEYQIYSDRLKIDRFILVDWRLKWLLVIPVVDGGRSHTWTHTHVNTCTYSSISASNHFPVLWARGNNP